MSMTRQHGKAGASSGSPLRPAAVGNGRSGGLIAGVVVLHLAAIGVGLWFMPRSPHTVPPTPVVLQLATVSRPHEAPAPVVSQPLPEPPPRADTKTPPKPAKIPPSPKAKPTLTRQNAPHNTMPPTKTQAAPETSPPAGDMLGNALASVHQQNWQNTSQRYAEDSAGGVQSALARYRQDWVRAIQAYVDLHFPKIHRDARLEFNVTVDRYGKLVGLDVVHSTGDAALDAKALKAIRAAAPFRPFDTGMGNRQTLTFRQGWVFNQGALLEP